MIGKGYFCRFQSYYDALRMKYKAHHLALPLRLLPDVGLSDL
jgi:hypothetical protein